MELSSPKRVRGITGGFCELTLEAHDPARLADFYRAVFGWPELSSQEDRIWLACGERARLGLWSRGPKEFGDEGVRALTAQGVGHKGPIEHEGGNRSLYFEDPEGNVVEAWDFFECGEGARDGVAALT